MKIDPWCVCVKGDGCPCAASTGRLTPTVSIPKSNIINLSDGKVEVQLQDGKMVSAEEVSGQVVKAWNRASLRVEGTKMRFESENIANQRDSTIAQNKSKPKDWIPPGDHNWLDTVLYAYAKANEALGERAGWVYCRFKGPSCGGATR